MAAPGWRTSLVVQGLDLRTERAVPVVVGLLQLTPYRRGDVIVAGLAAFPPAAPAPARLLCDECGEDA